MNSVQYFSAYSFQLFHLCRFKLKKNVISVWTVFMEIIYFIFCISNVFKSKNISLWILFTLISFIVWMFFKSKNFSLWILILFLAEFYRFIVLSFYFSYSYSFSCSLLLKLPAMRSAIIINSWAFINEIKLALSVQIWWSIYIY